MIARKGGQLPPCHGKIDAYLFLTENSAAITTDFNRFDNVTETSFFGSGSTQASHDGRTNDTAQSSQFKLGQNLDNKDVVSVQEVESEI